MQYFDVIVLGGGAAGMMCALTAGQRGRTVLLLEGSNKVGKKILMSGGGRCNFTNLNVDAQQYISHNPHFCKSALAQYTQWDFIALVERHGIAYHERKYGELFCDHSARDILAMLMAEAQQAGVCIETRAAVQSIQPVNVPADARYRYQVRTDRLQACCHSLAIATGGLSIPTMGASGLGYEIARQFGLPVYATRAGLVPFTFTDSLKSMMQKLSGVSVDS
ncbi:MAG TPA: aminoacetone oxidase family FAD-binding enzyme, partial [Methylotenera sp.]|nr:aminoacetone oxidase family FAD-binding enzyme [Methylotenera sp.]